MFAFMKMDSHQECDNKTVDLYTTEKLDTRYRFEDIKPENRLIELKNFTENNKTFQFINIHQFESLNFTRLFIGRITRGQVKAYVEYQIQIVDCSLKKFVLINQSAFVVEFNSTDDEA